MDAIEERRKLYAGFGDTFSRAIEFVATPAIFAFLGHLIDGRTHTAPLFMLGFGVFAVVGMFLRFLMAYSQAMDAEQAERPWAKKYRPAGREAIVSPSTQRQS